MLTNFLLHPFVLGRYSKNNGGDFVITTPNNSEFRTLGTFNWQHFEDPAPYPRVYNENLSTVEDISFKAFLRVIWAEANVNPKVYFFKNFLQLEVYSAAFAIFSNLSGLYPTSFLLLSKVSFLLTCIGTAIHTYIKLLTKQK